MPGKYLTPSTTDTAPCRVARFDGEECDMRLASACSGSHGRARSDGHPTCVVRHDMLTCLLAGL
eukprot:366551-Chlamydomonas_euryale.AAC.9